MYFLGVKAAGAQGWQPYHHPVPLSWNLGTLTSWNPLGHSRPVTALLYLFTFTFTSAVFAVRVQWPIWLFLQFINVVLSRCVAQVLSECFEMVPVAPVITGITFVLTFHTRWISVMRSLYFEIFPASFFITFLSPGIATYINTRVPVLLLSLLVFCYLAYPLITTELY